MILFLNLLPSSILLTKKTQQLAPVFKEIILDYGLSCRNCILLCYTANIILNSRLSDARITAKGTSNISEKIHILLAAYKNSK